MHVAHCYILCFCASLCNCVVWSFSLPPRSVFFFPACRASIPFPFPFLSGSLSGRIVLVCFRPTLPIVSWKIDGGILRPLTSKIYIIFLFLSLFLVFLFLSLARTRSRPASATVMQT